MTIDGIMKMKKKPEAYNSIESVSVSKPEVQLIFQTMGSGTTVGKAPRYLFHFSGAH